MSADRIDNFVSVVTVAHDNGRALPDFLTRLEAMLRRSFADFEIIVVNWRSTDDTETVMEELLRKVTSVRYLRLADSASHDVAWLAGMESTIGDFVVTIHPQADPIEMIPKLVEESRAGHDIVIGTSRTIRKSIPYRLVHSVLRRLVVKFGGIEIRPNTTYLRSYSRRTINAIFQASSRFKPLEVRVAALGYRTKCFEYELLDRSKFPRRSALREIERGVKLAVFASLRPLRWISLFGVASSIISVIVALYTVVVRMLKNNLEPGWASIVVIVSVYFSLLFIMLFFLFEYFGRLFEEGGVEQQYSVVSEKNSSVMIAGDRINVLDEAESGSSNAVQTGRNR